MAHRRDVLVPHRLDVHQRAAVAQLKAAVAVVVDDKPEVHELGRRTDVELDALEDRLDRVTLETQQRLHAFGVDRAGRHPLPDRHLGHRLPTQVANHMGHACAIDEVTGQQQLPHQFRQVAVRPAAPRGPGDRRSHIAAIQGSKSRPSSLMALPRAILLIVGWGRCPNNSSATCLDRGNVPSWCG